MYPTSSASRTQQANPHLQAICTSTMGRCSAKKRPQKVKTQVQACMLQSCTVSKTSRQTYILFTKRSICWFQERAEAKEAVTFFCYLLLCFVFYSQNCFGQFPVTRQGETSFAVSFLHKNTWSHFTCVQLHGCKWPHTYTKQHNQHFHVFILCNKKRQQMHEVLNGCLFSLLYVVGIVCWKKQFMGEVNILHAALWRGTQQFC